MEVLNLKESKNSLLSRVKYLKRKSSKNDIKEKCDELISSIQSIESFTMYKDVDQIVEQLNIELGDLLKHYDPFDDCDDCSDNSDITDTDSLEDCRELDWWEIEDSQPKKMTIRFNLPDEKEELFTSFESDEVTIESLQKISKRLDLYDRIRKKQIRKEITVECKERILEFMRYCNRFMNVEKWFKMKQFIQERDRMDLYDDFKCSRINQQFNECYVDSDDIKLDIDIENIDYLHYISEINKKVDELQHSTILKFAIMFRIENPYFDIYDEIKDLYEMIITSEMNFYYKNLLQLLLEPDIEEMFDI